MSYLNPADRLRSGHYPGPRSEEFAEAREKIKKHRHIQEIDWCSEWSEKVYQGRYGSVRLPCTNGRDHEGPCSFEGK